MRARPAEIQLAYQRIASAIDPAAGARPDPEQFLEVQNAYQVLSDPRRRRAYDIGLSMNRRPFSAELPRVKAPVVIPNDFLTMNPSLDELLDHVMQNFLGYRRKSEGPFRGLSFEAMLRREDTRFGCHLPVSIADIVSRVTFEIPSGTRDGDLFEMNLDGVGIHNLSLQVRVVVRENLE
jgi:hypothetical protein